MTNNDYMILCHQKTVIISYLYSVIFAVGWPHNPSVYRHRYIQGVYGHVMNLLPRGPASKRLNCLYGQQKKKRNLNRPRKHFALIGYAMLIYEIEFEVIVG